MVSVSAPAELHELTPKLKMPAAEDTRESLRFTQNEDKTFTAVTDPNVPEWQRTFINMMWYARIPTVLWNSFSKMSQTSCSKFLAGKQVQIEDWQQQVLVALTERAVFLYSERVLPCTDSRALPGILKLAIDYKGFNDKLTAQQEQISLLQAQLTPTSPAEQ